MENNISVPNQDTTMAKKHHKFSVLDYAIIILIIGIIAITIVYYFVIAPNVANNAITTIRSDYVAALNANDDVKVQSLINDLESATQNPSAGYETASEGKMVVYGFYFKKGDYAKALQVINDILNLSGIPNSDYITLSISKAELHRRLGNYQSAIDTYQSILDLPEHNLNYEDWEHDVKPAIESELESLKKESSAN